MEYKHGAYGVIQGTGARQAAQGARAVVYVGTAPVHLTAGGAGRVGTPVIARDMAAAKNLLGYSDDWASYTLCEPMRAHFELAGAGPLVFINVLDPMKHKAAAGGDIKVKTSNGRAVIAEAENIYLDSIQVTGKEAGVDFMARYDHASRSIILQELKAGGLGGEPEITYTVIDPSLVTDVDIIGATDGQGINSGLYAVKSVYQLTGMIPSELLCPGFSSSPAVHKAMLENRRHINGHWAAYVRADLPIMDGGNPITLYGARAWADANGYSDPGETIYFPLATGLDGRKYHLSVLAAANLQLILAAEGGIPFKSPSNTEIPIRNLYFGPGNEGRLWDDEMINNNLNSKGIASAAFVSGRGAIWGPHAADYDYARSEPEGTFETTRMMLYYLSNDFQTRRARDVDEPMSRNDLSTMIAEEQARIDALIKAGCLASGTVFIKSDEIARSDMLKGDYVFSFKVSTVPLGKSLTADIAWDSEGFAAYYE